jgi:hypothetical protein
MQTEERFCNKPDYVMLICFVTMVSFTVSKPAVLGMTSDWYVEDCWFGDVQRNETQQTKTNTVSEFCDNGALV